MKKKNIIVIILIGIGVALITAALVIVYASHPNRANPVDKTIADFFFNIDNSTLETIMKVITYLGESIIYIGVLLILYYAWDKKKAYRAIFVVVSSTVINASSKAAFSLDRPDTSWGYADPGEPSYGLPSGHAQISSTFWGVLTSFITKWGIITVAIILPLLIGFSRIYLVVHWFTDVLMGFGLGLIIIAIYLIIKQPIENHLEKQSTVIKMSYIGVLLVVLGLPIIFLHDLGVQAEKEYIIKNLKYLALFITASIAYVFEKNLVNFENKVDKWWKIIIRIMFGIVVIALIYLYDNVFYDPEPVTQTKMIVDLVVYSLLGPIVILLIPWLIKKLKC